MTILTGDQIALARLMALNKMLKLETLGMEKRGKSAYAILKSELNLRGNRKSVYDQVLKIIFEQTQLQLPLEDKEDATAANAGADTGREVSVTRSS